MSITPKDERHRRTSLSCAAELQGIVSQRTEKAKMPAYFDDVGQGSGNMQAECVGGLTCGRRVCESRTCEQLKDTGERHAVVHVLPRVVTS